MTLNPKANIKKIPSSILTKTSIVLKSKSKQQSLRNFREAC